MVSSPGVEMLCEDRGMCVVCGEWSVECGLPPQYTYMYLTLHYEETMD